MKKERKVNKFTLQKWGLKWKWMFRILFLVLTLGMFPAGRAAASTAGKARREKKITVIQRKHKTIRLKNAKGTVKWNVLLGYECISLKKKGKAAATVRGVEPGTAKIRAAVGEKILIFKIKVIEDKNPPKGADRQDVAAIRKLIAGQKKRGAWVSEALGSDQYTWRKGKLVGIDWDTVKLSGRLDISDCVHLTQFDGSGNRLTGLNASGNDRMVSLSCVDNDLRDLDVSGCVNLQWLQCEENALSNLNISGCGKLKRLECGENQLGSLDVTKNINLEELSCSRNQLRELDVSPCTKLKNFNCSYNQLSNLDVTKNVDLGYFCCHYNQLTSLDVKNQDKLLFFFCGNNRLGSLDVSSCTGLAALECENNPLGNLDVTENVRLSWLRCSGNQLSSLDVTKNVWLVGLYCDNNQLSRLDVSACADLEM